jgi:hypothetical protein
MTRTPTQTHSDAFALARTRRERGIVSSTLHAEDDSKGWADRAQMHLLRFAARRTTPFTAEQFRLHALTHGLDAPAEMRAFGGVLLRALHNGVVTRVGFAPTAASNGSHRAQYIGTGAP